MRCETYSADIPVSTCLARQRRNVRNGTKWGDQGGFCFDPNCAVCEQGRRIMAEFGGVKSTGPRAKVTGVKMAGDATVKTKTCKKCGQLKAIDEFYIVGSMRDNRDSACKECRNRYSKEYNRKKADEREQRKQALNPHAEKIEGGVGVGDASDAGRPSVSTVDQISIQRTDRETVLIDVGIACFEHIDIVIRPRKPNNKEERHVEES